MTSAKLKYPLGYAAATPTGVTLNAIAADYPQRTLRVTPTASWIAVLRYKTLNTFLLYKYEHLLDYVIVCDLVKLCLMKSIIASLMQTLTKPTMIWIAWETYATRMMIMMVSRNNLKIIYAFPYGIEHSVSNKVCIMSCYVVEHSLTFV